ncbi:transferase family protein [Teratosphaeria destructans]|uniref:Transferase family protein n=1 Tax=Teratosphaeria destructans TaxID=418781 RepID=A0A9W7SRZ2_9PEZI|nr:transferase family protein [Teratosphaeria destructans]
MDAPTTLQRKAISLSTLDSFYAPKIYTTTVLGYDLATLGTTGPDLLIDLLRNMITEIVKQYPILAGTVRLDPGCQGKRMVAHLPDEDDTAVAMMDRIFRIVKHEHESTVTYEMLRSAEFAPGGLDIGRLAPFETNTDPAVANAVFAVQVNVIPGGILVAFQLHHTIVDGKTLSQIATYMTALLTGSGMPQEQRPEVRFTVPELEDGIAVRDPWAMAEECPERVLVEEGSMPPHVNRPGGVIVQTFLLTSIAQVEELHKKCNRALLEHHDLTGPVSKNDVLGACLWSAITSARFKGKRDLSAMMRTISACHVPCDIRKKVDPPIPDEYFGTATLMVRAQHTIIDLIAAIDAFHVQQDALPLAKIALSIRQAVAGVDTEFVRRRIQLALSVEAHNLAARETGADKLQIRHGFKSEEHVDVVFSTLAPIFKMETAALQMVQPDFLRPLHHAMIDGIVDVVPAVKGDRVEMTVALEEEVVKRLLEMAVSTGFTKPPVL